MCRAVTCKQCGKTTWAGCGQHVDQVMREVPTSQRCPGNHPAAPSKRSTSSLFARLFGR